MNSYLNSIASLIVMLTIMIASSGIFYFPNLLICIAIILIVFGR